MDLVIRGGHVLQPKSFGIADMHIRNGRIEDVGHDISVPEQSEILDAAGSIIIPGLINSHTHAHNNLLKGFADNFTLEELRAYGPALLLGRSVEEQYVSAAIGAIEMLRTGCTAAFDMFTAAPAMTAESVEAVVSAYRDVGMRAVLAPSMNDGAFYRSVPGLAEALPRDLGEALEATRSTPAGALLEMTENAVRRWHGADGGRIAIAASAAVPGECSDQFLTGLADLVERCGVQFQTHLAETKIQAIGALERWSEPLVMHLVRCGLIGPRFVGGHGIWLDDGEMSILAGSGAMIAHNPASNLRIGSGIAPIFELRQAGATVGLGSDGSLSSDNQNMFEAMRFAALVNKVRFPYDTARWLGAADVWDIATRGSSRILGLDGRIGALAPGCEADLVILRADSPFLRPLNDITSALVHAETGADVDKVFVGGKLVVDGGRVLTVDERGLRERAQAAADRLRRLLPQSTQLVSRLLPFLRSTCAACAARAHPIDRFAGPLPRRPAH